MKKLIQIVSMILVEALCVALVLTGCGSSNFSTPIVAPTQASTTPQLDKVTLIGYLLGQVPPAGPEVMTEVNKKLEKDINASIDLRYISLAEYQTKYPLILAAGQDVDWLYGNVNYIQNAVKGGYFEITMKDVGKYMPLTFKATSEAAWQDALVNGKIFMIPQSFKELDTGAIFHREDLRKKYNVPEIKTVADYVPYMEAIKKNEPGMMPYQGTPDDIMTMFNFYIESISGFAYYKGEGGMFFYNIDDPTYKLVGFFDDEFLAAYKKSAQWIKGIYAKGLLPKNAFANKTAAKDLFKAGKSAMSSDAFEQLTSVRSDAKGAGWEVGCCPMLSPAGHVTIRPATGNGVSIAASCKNPQRVMMAMDLIFQEKSYNYLVSFGIEGRHYVMKDGKLDIAPGIDPAKNPYGLYAAGWWFTNRDQWPPMVSQDRYYLGKKKEMLAAVQPCMLQGFNPDFESVKTEAANITNVLSQYNKPIKLGMVKDIDTAIKELQDKLKVAGYEKVQTLVRAQAQKYITAHTKK